MAAQALLEPLPTPEDVVRRLVCVQGQELRQVVAAIALRCRGSARDVVEAFDAGRLVRGYPMRGTIFVAHAEQLDRLTALTRDRQLAAGRRRHAELGIDEGTDELARTVLAERFSASVDRLLAGDVDGVRAATAERIVAAGGCASRRELVDAWQAAGLEPAGGRAYHLLNRLVLRGELCLGPWIAGGQVYVRSAPWRTANGIRSDAWIIADADPGWDGPPGASAELVEQVLATGDRDASILDWFGGYVRGHGPVSVRDFSWWTKLPLGEVRRAVAPLLPFLAEWGLDDRGEALWAWTVAAPADASHGAEAPPPGSPPASSAASADPVLLLPGFDELYLGYPDRGFLIDLEHEPLLSPGGNGVFRPFAVSGGRAVATWATSTADVRRRAGEAEVRVHEFGRPSSRLRRGIERAARAMPYPEAAPD